MMHPPPRPRRAVDEGVLWLLRTALIQALNVVEDALGLPRSVAPRRRSPPA